MPKTLAQQLADHEKFVATEPRYTVVCNECGQYFYPLVKSPLWWRAKKKADEGFFDALYVSGRDCGCVKERYRPEAPFRVLGYDMDCSEYDIPCDTFVQAVTLFRKCKRYGDVVFIEGVSKAVEDAIRYGID